MSGEGKEPQTLKDGEIAVKKDDWDRVEAKAKDMDRYKSEARKLKEDLDDLQEKVQKLEDAAKAKPSEGEPDPKAVEAAVADARKELEKSHKKALDEQERKLKVQFAARLALVSAGAKDLYLGSIDLSDVADEATAKERVAAFLKDNPEVVKKAQEPEPKAPPATTGPSGPPTPGQKPPEGPKTPKEREALLRDHLRSQNVAIVRGSGGPTTPG